MDKLNIIKPIVLLRNDAYENELTLSVDSTTKRPRTNC